MNNPVYIPILKFKGGEKAALRQLNPNISSAVRPLLMLANEEDLSNLPKIIAGILGNGNPFYIDILPELCEKLGTQKAEQYLLKALNVLGQAGIPFIPIAHPANLASLGPVAADSSFIARGVGIRMSLDEAVNAPTILAKMTQKLGCTTRNLDIIIDAGHIVGLAQPLLNTVANSIISYVNTIKAMIPTPRLIAVAASAFPTALTGIPQDDISTKERLDWVLWKHIHKSIPDVVFSDYGADDPFNPDHSAGARIIPTIRYTLGDKWYISRGHYNPQKPRDYSQFHQVAAQIINKKGIFQGITFSAGDQKIHDVGSARCIGQGCKHGSLTTWVTVAQNHHITHVVDQLSSPLVP